MKQMEKEAKKTINEALSNARSIDLFSYASDLEAQGLTERSNEITKLNYKRHSKDWVANMGMALLKEKEGKPIDAIKMLQTALGDAPKPNKLMIASHVKRIQKSIQKK